MRAINTRTNIIRFEKSKAFEFIVKSAEKYKPMTAAQEQKCKPEDLVKHNILFAVAVASKHYYSGCDICDLVQESIIGMIEASKMYDPNYGVKFISYAVKRMRRKVLEYITVHGSQIRYTHQVQNVQYKIHDNTDEITDEELAEKIGCSVDILKQAKQMYKIESLDREDEDGDQIYQPAGYFDADHNVKQIQRSEMMRKINSLLTKQEQEIIHTLHLADFPLNRDRLAERLKLTPERIRQIEQQALNKLKNHRELFQI